MSAAAPVQRDRRQRSTLIISAWPYQAFDKNLPFGSFQMPPAPRCAVDGRRMCKVHKPYSRLVVGKRKEGVDLGDDRVRVEIIDDLDIAYDLVNESEQYGLVVCEGAEPTDEEVEQAYAKLEAYLRPVLEQEDAIRSATGNPFNPEHARIACEFFGEVRNWTSDVSPKVVCPSCGAHNAAGLARCNGCQAVLDWEKAREFGMLNQHQEAFAMATGKLKPVTIDEPEPDPTPRVARGKRAKTEPPAEPEL